MENIEKDNLELVLREFTEQQMEMEKQVDNLKKAVASLEEKTNSFEKKLENFKVISPPVDTAPIQKIVSQSMNDVKTIIGEQPKNIIQSKRFLFFPEHNSREYYSVVLRWILYIIIATYCYLLLKHMVDHWTI